MQVGGGTPSAGLCAPSYDLGDVFTDQTSGTLCPTGDRSELVGGAVSYRHAGENDTYALTRETWVQDV